MTQTELWIDGAQQNFAIPLLMKLQVDHPNYMFVPWISPDGDFIKIFSWDVNDLNRSHEEKYPNPTLRAGDIACCYSHMDHYTDTVLAAYDHFVKAAQL